MTNESDDVNLTIDELNDPYREYAHNALGTELTCKKNFDSTHTFTVSREHFEALVDPAELAESIPCPKIGYTLAAASIDGPECGLHVHTYKTWNTHFS